MRIQLKIAVSASLKGLAERERFELSEPLRVQRFSRPSHSTTLASFLLVNLNLNRHIKLIIFPV